MQNFQNNKNLAEFSDEQLVQIYLDGDQTAFDYLVKNNLNSIYNFVFKYTHTAEAAEDVTQEVFLKIWKNLKKFNSRYKFKTWAFTIAKNTALDHLKKRGIIPFSVLDAERPGDFSETLVNDTPLADSVLENLDNVALIGHALAKLPEKQRTVIELYYKSGFNFREIAQTLKESINTVKTRHRRALLVLRKMIGKS